MLHFQLGAQGVFVGKCVGGRGVCVGGGYSEFQNALCYMYFFFYLQGSSIALGAFFPFETARTRKQRKSEI